MKGFSPIAAVAALAASASAQAIQGFNYGATLTTGAAKTVDDFTSEFNQAKGLQGGHPGQFTSARLYTCIQAGTANSPSSAFEAAINTNTRMLLGLWASAGEANIQNEIAALTSAISQYGSRMVDLIDGISVGSEDLYRISPTGIENMSGVGAGPQEVANYIGEVRQALSSTAASGALIGHVDTWTAWVNGSNSAVTDACDFIGMDAYPYFQTTLANGIENGQQVFNDALDATRGAVGGKPVWITETGWPVSGPKSGDAVASIDNAETFWSQVACQYLGTVNTWWYTLQDATPDTPSPSFGLVGAAGGEMPLYDLSCGAKNSTSSSSSAASSATVSVGSSSVVASTLTGVSSPVNGQPGASVTASATAGSGGSGNGTAPISMSGVPAVSTVTDSMGAPVGTSTVGYAAAGPNGNPANTGASGAFGSAAASTPTGYNGGYAATGTPAVYSGGASYPTAMANLALAGAGFAAAALL